MKQRIQTSVIEFVLSNMKLPGKWGLQGLPWAVGHRECLPASCCFVLILTKRSERSHLVVTPNPEQSNEWGQRRRGRGHPGLPLDRALVLQVGSLFAVCLGCPGEARSSRGFVVCRPNLDGTQGRDSGPTLSSGGPSTDSPWKENGAHSALPGEEGLVVGGEH